MECGRARNCIYSEKIGSASCPTPSPSPEEIAEAREHVAGCGACQEFFAAEDRLRLFLRRRAPRDKPSAKLRERVFAGIAAERGASGRVSNWKEYLRVRRVGWTAAGLAMAGLITSGIWIFQTWIRSESPALSAILIDDHLGNLSSATDIATSDPDAVQKWFRERTGFAFRLPATSEPQLIGGRLCYLRGRRAALIRYRHPQSPVSLFIIDGGDMELAQSHLIALDGKRCMLDARKGYNVVLWKERGLVYGLVSDVHSGELLQLAAKF